MTERRAGRHNQRERTRRAIVAAAARLIEEGSLPSTAEVAEAALVSPATAYRYFPDNLGLLGAALQDASSGLAARFAPDLDDAPEDPLARAEEAAGAYLERIASRERLIRGVIALSLLRSVDAAAPSEAAAEVRPGFRRAWIDEALRPLRGQVPRARLRRLELALGVIMGPEALIALRDTMGAEPEEAAAVCRWMARALTAATLDEPPARRRRTA
ncbi:MAG TPA: TetR family transcriptional regulator [Solirubrobacteraceae bacterium]|nr:TetR family transcriptional regulator [Solirubrobacteraceae bacterium]